MKKWISANFPSFRAKSDLGEEELEELRMLSAFPPNEIHRLRHEFIRFTGGIGEHMTTEQFLNNIPVIAINPLRERLADCFGLRSKSQITFQEFIVNLAAFNGSGGIEQKLKLAFKLHDFDGDGKISKADLLSYLELVSAASEGTSIDYGEVAEEILKESSADEEELRFLTYEAFHRIINPTEFDTKLRISI